MTSLFRQFINQGRQKWNTASLRTLYVEDIFDFMLMFCVFLCYVYCTDRFLCTITKPLYEIGS